MFSKKEKDFYDLSLDELEDVKNKTLLKLHEINNAIRYKKDIEDRKDMIIYQQQQIIKELQSKIIREVD